MSQIIIYGFKNSLKQYQSSLSDAIHKALIEALAYPADKKFQRFIGLEKEELIFPSDRSNQYTIIEISMFEGRSMQTKKMLIRLLFEYIEKEVGIAPQDIEITIFEMPAHNWGIRGHCADELALNYKVAI